MATVRRDAAGLGSAARPVPPRGQEGSHQADGAAPQEAPGHASLQIVGLGGRHAGHTNASPQVFKSNGPLRWYRASVPLAAGQPMATVSSCRWGALGFL